MSGRVDEPSAGYGKPPLSSRFSKGKSGNPKGRPRGSGKLVPYEAVLGQLVTIRERGIEQKVTAAEAFLLHMTKLGLGGDGTAGRSTMAVIKEARRRRGDMDEDAVTAIVRIPVTPGSVNMAMVPLGIATKLDRFRASSKMLIEPWIVQKALARLGARRLTSRQQQIVVDATRSPAKVKWPKWWEALP